MEESVGSGGRQVGVEPPLAANDRMNAIPNQEQSAPRTGDGKTTMDAPDADSASDVSMATDSDDMDVGQPQQGSRVDGNQSPLAEDAISRKRKSPGSERDDRSQTRDAVSGNSKKVKLDAADQGTHPISRPRIPADRSLLSPEIWRRVFGFCPPKALGNLLCVNKLFKSYLDPSSTASSSSNLQPNAIWQGSRRLFWPQMPTPLRGKTELDMWRLACLLTCQFCGKKDARPPTALCEPLRLGHGADGVACIWTFRAVCCTKCFSSNSIKEMDLLMSDFPTFLMPALTFVFSTSDGQIVPPGAIERGQVPQSSVLTKLFWSPDVDSIRQEFLSDKDLGAAAVEEWLKGLPSRGAEQKADAAKWEKYEDSGGVEQMRALLYPGYQPAPVAPTNPAATQSQPTSADQKAQESTGSSLPPSIASLPRHPMPQRPITGGTQAGGAPLSLLPRVMRPSHVERNKDEAERNKDEAEQLEAKKAEIVRRARLLDSRLGEDELQQNPAFRAAVQSISPLDDDTWDMLKPRLLSQVGEADNQSDTLLPVPRPPNSMTRKEPERSKSKEEIEADWDEIQGPVRLKILKYADEAIIGDWDDGEKVTKDNAPSFAVDVLLHVRKRFYVEVEKDAAAAHTAGKAPIVDPPKGPFTQKLTLENMKYVFDVKIRPLTEPLRKEIFLCNGCGYGAKFFGFEGVIQHYAAKHTTALSMGNIIVHWRAEWPAIPPFKPNPKASKNSFHPLPAIPPTPAPLGREAGAASRYGHSAPPPDQLHIPQQLSQIPPQPQLYPAGAQGHQYGPPPYGSEYQQSPSGPYSPVDQYHPNQPQYGQQPYPPHGQPAAYQPYAPSPTGPVGYQPPPITTAPQISPAQPPSGQASYGYGYGPYGQPPAFPDRLQLTTPYGEKLESMAHQARELWMSTSNMLNLPGVVRIYAVIFHLDKFFRSRFGEPLPLDLFIDGLSNHKDMRPVRNVNELPCKTCYMGLGAASSVTEDRKVFSLPQLLNHFHSSHEGQAHGNNPYGQPPLSWMADMLLLPYSSALQDMIGPKGQKYPMLAEAVAGLVDQDPYPQAQGAAWSGAADENGPNASMDNHNRFYGNAGPSPRAQHQQYQPQDGAPPKNGGRAYPTFGANDASDRSQNSSVAGRWPQQKGRSDNNNNNNNNNNNKPQKNRQGKEKKKKNGPKGGHGNDLQKHGGGEYSAAKRKEEEAMEEEEKRAEEEERKREDEIRAMWAAARTQAAQAQSTPVLAGAITPQTARSGVDSIYGPSRTNTPAVPQKRKPRTPHQPERHRPPPGRNEVLIKQEDKECLDIRNVQKTPHNAPQKESQKESQRAPQRAPPAHEAAPEPDLLGALEMHLSHAQERSPPPPPPPPPASRAVPVSVSVPTAPPARVIYVDERGREVMPPRESDRHIRYEPEHGRPRSPVYVRYADVPAPAPPMQQADPYRGRSPPLLRRYAGETPVVYETRPNTRHYVAADEREYERAVPPPPPTHGGYAQAAPPPRQEYYRVYADDARPTRPMEYASYGVVRVMHPDGDYYAQRPVRRESAAIARPEVDPQGTARYYDYAAPGPSYEESPGGGRPVRREAGAPPVSYTAAGYEHPQYERYGDGRGGGGPAGGRDVRDMQASARPDQGYYEEYDPHYPSAAAGSDGRRQMRYQ